jgi:hypothetical protein
MRGGKRLLPIKKLTEIRNYTHSQIIRIPVETQRLVNPQTYWVGLSESLADEKREAIRSFWKAHPR